MSIANRVTFFRLALTLFSFYAAVQKNPVFQVAALFIYLFAAGLDILDGFLARKFKGETAFGKILDPFVDKIQTLPPFVYFACYGLYSIFWVIPIVFREFIVTVVRFKMASRGIVLSSEKSGKLKTLSQHVSIVMSYFFYLGHQPFFEVSVGSSFWKTLHRWTYFYLVIALTLTIYSGLSFWMSNRKLIHFRVSNYG